MSVLRGTMPPWPLVARAAGVVAVVAVLVGAVWWATDRPTAQAFYAGLICMLVAVIHLGPAGQSAVALASGIAAGVGALVAGNTLLLAVAVVLACLVEWPFNRRSVAVAALLPFLLVLYAFAAPEQPLRVAVATWAGAAVVIAVGALGGVRAPAQPATVGEARRHAVALAVGCLALVLVFSVLGLVRGAWAVLTLCLVFVPTTEGTRSRVRTRIAGTLLGALVATGLAAVMPAAACFAFAALFAVLTVAYALASDDLRSVVFLTPTVLLLFGAGQSAPVLSLAGQRVVMTVLGGLLALLLTAVVMRPAPASGR